MRIAVVGSRDYPHMGRVAGLVIGWAAWLDAHPGRSITVVSGTEPPPLGVPRRRVDGCDEMAVRLARWLGLPTEVYHADWDRLGKAAGPSRNQTIVDRCDLLTCFWDEVSRGSCDVLARALAQGKVRAVYGVTGHPLPIEIVGELVRRAGR